MQDKNDNNGWATQEFDGVNLGDLRLKSRLIKLADRLALCPESSINQACGDWKTAKAAYRFFQNENVDEKEILGSHVSSTIKRFKDQKTVLVIQDTSYFNYNGHEETTGLGVISKHATTNKKLFTTSGLIMHTAFAVGLDGLPLGMVDQEVYARTPAPEDRSTRDTPIEEKESIRWLNALRKTKNAATESQANLITVCDREGDFYELFEYSSRIQSSLLVRANTDRIINTTGDENSEKHRNLWSKIQSLENSGFIQVETPGSSQKKPRTVKLETRFGAVFISPPRQHFRKRTEKLPDIKLYAINVIERDPPKGERPLEWMLLTDCPITSFEEASEKVSWYCLRWRIEVFHKVLKSGFRVEQCRLESADRLGRYLTIMSIIAWRIYWLTLIARLDPELPCTAILAEDEWKVLYSKANKSKPFPAEPPKVREVVRWIAGLGGFLGRKGDGDPGVMSLWRGWKRLCDLADGWTLALTLK